MHGATDARAVVENVPVYSVFTAGYACSGEVAVMTQAERTCGRNGHCCVYLELSA
jgi:hypothetical protein